MYLSRLHISKFRVFDDITLYFKNGINILIGENNSGKTAIIDALRICLGCGKQTIIFMYKKAICMYNRENETYNFLKRNVQFSLFFTPSKQRHLITI